MFQPAQSDRIFFKVGTPRVGSLCPTTIEQGWKQKDTNEMILSIFFCILHFYTLLTPFLHSC